MDEIKVVREPSPKEKSMFKWFTVMTLIIIVGSLGYVFWTV